MIDGLTIVAVVAAARNRVIGADGGMPWSIPSDLKRYRRLTMGKPMIMGRKTLQSIGKALDGRDTIVLTRSGDVDVEGVLVARDRDESLRIAAACAKERGAGEITVVGGAEIYRLLWSAIDRIEMTEIDAEPGGDTLFPEIDPAAFNLLSEEPWSRGEKDSAATRLKTYAARSVCDQD
ncbi:dihydrofolate reductase [Fulvimarina endophytica]|uniref:Dihydrofolate reductase n=1 Tax=Fulvimarina endophytica TaxID=2293836 RepID=A0A371X083_9HYPH|nr:dihydrofolate reductase [Fulvimarina endophytica]RFC62616.1 dihydrofolate reductase [Fulvimarina endophytica]